MTRPAHAFPTTYPPPLRPPSAVAPVEWSRIPKASPSPPSTSTIDLDSLCNRFAASLIIDDNPQQHRQPEPSIFSPPAVGRLECTMGHSCLKPQKRKKTRAEAPPKPSPLSTKANPTQRKTSAPARVSTPQHAPGLPRPPDTIRHTTPTTPTSPDAPTAGYQDTHSHPSPSAPHHLRPLPKSVLDQTTHTPQNMSYLPTGPTTPPTLLPDLISEPVVVPSTPIRLSPGSSLITDPFLQFQPQYDYFSDPSLVSAFNYSGSTPGLATAGFSPKSAFDMPLGFDHLFHGIPAPIMVNPFGNNSFDVDPVS